MKDGGQIYVACEVFFLDDWGKIPALQRSVYKDVT